MSTTTLTIENFVETIQTPGIVFVDWWAAWCGPCRAFAPIFEAAARRHPEVTFAKIDTDAQPELAGQFRIQSIPTLMAFRDGVLLFAQPGMLPASALDELVAKIRALDMNAVRSTIAERDAAPARTERAR
jgi:thioredoxin 1